MTNLTSPFRPRKRDYNKKPTKVQALKAGLLLVFMIFVLIFIIFQLTRI